MTIPFRDRRGGPAARRRAAALLVDGRAGEPSGAEPELAAELEAMSSIIATLEQIPERAWLSELGPAPERRAAAARARRTWRPSRSIGGSPWAGALVAATCLVVAFLVGSLTHPLSSSSTRAPAAGPDVVLRPVSTSGAGHSLAVAHMLGGNRRMHLQVVHLPPSRPGTYYELWLMTSTKDLVSVSSFRLSASGSGNLDLILPDNPGRYRYLDISVQRVGGSPAISSDSVLRGAIPA
ncbi:MAG TPA: anti-sigma factor [Solirubrobacteraceae bacterium]|nr:anti-sigma factor [Solirubrobacteraceae bacterium]